jgi:cell division protease FtsH
MPDEKTRKSIIDIHIRGKPYDETITKEDLVYQTAGFSGAKIENLLNEAMLLALRNNKEEFTSKELDEIMNRVLAGWLPNEHVVSNDTIERIAIHEMGHAIMGVLSKHHANVSKIIINLSSPKSPGYTVFETEQTPLYTRETLFEHLMILLAGRVAEQVIYDVSITTGAINDFEEALHLAEKMITYYGMGKHIIYPNSSDKYKEMIDNEVSKLIKDAYQCTEVVLQNMKPAIIEGANRLKETRTMKVDELMNIIHRIYPDMADNTI